MSKTATFIGDTIDCLGGATEFTVLLGNTNVRVGLDRKFTS